MADGGLGARGAAIRDGTREGEVRGNVEELTEGLAEETTKSGKLWTRRIGGVDLRAPEVKTMMLRSTAASSGRVRRVGSFMGSGRSSGMPSGSEGVAVAPVTASAAMGSARAREGERAEEREERGRATGE